MTDRKTPEERERWFSMMEHIDSQMCKCCRSVPCIREILEDYKFDIPYQRTRPVRYKEARYMEVRSQAEHQYSTIITEYQ